MQWSLFHFFVNVYTFLDSPVSFCPLMVARNVKISIDILENFFSIQNDLQLSEANVQHFVYLLQESRLDQKKTKTRMLCHRFSVDDYFPTCE